MVVIQFYSFSDYNFQTETKTTLQQVELGKPEAAVRPGLLLPRLIAAM